MDLPKYTFGEVIKYSISETPIEHYQTVITGYNLTNKLLPLKPETQEQTNKTLSFTGERTWNYMALVFFLLGLILLVFYKKKSID